MSPQDDLVVPGQTSDVDLLDIDQFGRPVTKHQFAAYVNSFDDAPSDESEKKPFHDA